MLTILIGEYTYDNDPACSTMLFETEHPSTLRATIAGLARDYVGDDCDELMFEDIMNLVNEPDFQDILENNGITVVDTRYAADIMYYDEPWD